MGYYLYICRSSVSQCTVLLSEAASRVVTYRSLRIPAVEYYIWHLCWFNIRV